MLPGEAAMRATILASLVAYAAAEYLWFGHRAAAFRARAVLWTAAAVLCIAHAALAFEVRHDWSHDAAWAQTAAQTAAVTGLDWGGGLYVNYVFLVLWGADVAWLWSSPRSYLRRPAVVSAAVSASALFMFINGAVVFVRGPARIPGAIAVAVVMWAWWRGRDKIVTA
jgi:hypothetical protein